MRIPFIGLLGVVLMVTVGCGARSQAPTQPRDARCQAMDAGEAATMSAQEGWQRVREGVAIGQCAEGIDWCLVREATVGPLGIPFARTVEASLHDPETVVIRWHADRGGTVQYSGTGIALWDLRGPTESLLVFEHWDERILDGDQPRRCTISRRITLRPDGVSLGAPGVQGECAFWLERERGIVID